MKRRSFVEKSLTTSALAFIPNFSIPAILSKEKMGISQATYAVRWRNKDQVTDYPAFNDAMEVIEHCHQLDAGGIQWGVGGWTKDFAKKVRKKCDDYGLYFEGQIRLPQEDEDLSRFENDVIASREAGANVNRTACLGGRRYANFSTMTEFLAFKEKSLKSIERAEPILSKHKTKLAIENHKDWRANELVEIIKKFDSEWIGVTLDTGNNISFMEDPMYVIETLAPYAFSTHIKDMAYNEYEDGILLSEVPLGEGIVDLKMAIALCKKYNPNITFNLEMITRDPLKVPCLTEQYWATFDHRESGKELAMILKNAKTKTFNLPTTSEKDPRSILAYEELNNMKSLNYAEQKLGLF
ncbi:MAG: sugar phosphate isomerase/epimerase family protein [Bacteroidota bacterium]